MVRLLIFTLSLLLSLPSNSNPISNDNTIILIMVDGARPDNVDYLVKQGRLPNIQRYFYDEGSVFQNSFTSLSLTVPSWSSILTGRDIDRTAIKGNDIFDRQTKQIENYLDWRKDILFQDYRNHGRAYRALRGLGHKTILDYFNRPEKKDREGLVVDDYGSDSDIFATFFPLNDKFPLYLFGTTVNNLLQLDTAKQTSAHNALIRLLYEKKDFYALDRDAVEQTLKVINAKEGKQKKLILLYFSAVDHYAHLEHGKGMSALNMVDSEIGRVMRAIKRSRYKDSTIALISDHGSQGGKELDIPSSNHPLKGQSYALTSTNLSYLFTGWYNIPGYDQYAFNTTSTFASEGKFSLRSWKEFQLQPFQCTNDAKLFNIPYITCSMKHKDSPEQIQAGVTTSQTISIPVGGTSSNLWSKTNNWHSLTHYAVQKTKSGSQIFRNIIKDLERFEIPNIKSYSLESESKTSKRPSDWIAISINKSDFNKSMASTSNLRSENDVILVHHSDISQGLILMRENADGKMEYRYQPIRNFDQSADGTVSFELTNLNDPFYYIKSDFVERTSLTNGFVSDEVWFKNYHSDREWAARYASSQYPNAVSAVYKMFSLRKEASIASESTRFDILVNPAYGHIFTVENDDLEANHGMFQREAVRNTFMIRGPRVKSGFTQTTPVFAVDVIPTLFKAAAKVDSESLKSMDLDGEAAVDVINGN